MATFEDAPSWIKLALLKVVLGLLLLLFALPTVYHTPYYGAVQACLVAAVGCLLVAVTLIYTWLYLPEVRGTTPVLLIFVMFTISAAFLTLLGISLWMYIDPGVRGTFPAMLTIGCSIMTLASSTFAILEMKGIKVTCRNEPSAERDVERETLYQ